MYILQVIYDTQGNGVEGNSIVCQSLKAAIDKAKELQMDFAYNYGIPYAGYIEEYDENVGVLFRRISEGSLGGLVAESEDGDRMWIEIKEIVEGDIVKEKVRMTKDEIIDKFLKMECGLVGEFLTDNKGLLGEVYDSRFIYIYTPKEVADLIEEGNDEGYNITMEMRILHDEFLVVTKINNPHYREMVIVGLGANNEDWFDYFHLDELVEKILANDELYDRFERVCAMDDEI